MAEVAHRFVTTNGIRMHYVEAGSGPRVLFCHGAPESWYSWRHQLHALADAGFHAIAPDTRGYGQTEQPKEVEAYDIFQLTGDLVGVVNALGGEPVAIVGHDWGAWITQFAALFRPDLFRAVALLSVPYLPRLSISPSAWEQQTYPGKLFYQQALRTPGIETSMEADVYGTIVNVLYSASGEPPVEERWKFVMDPVDSKNFAAASIGMASTPKKPSFVTDADIEFYVGEFKRSGFGAMLNYYRNVDRNWALTPFLDGAKLRQPTLFIAGDRDGVLGFWGDEVEAMERTVPNLHRKLILLGVGHWTQQESPDAVNQALIEFLRGL